MLKTLGNLFTLVAGLTICVTAVMAALDGQWDKASFYVLLILCIGQTQLIDLIKGDRP
ncbi:MAG: hypothetical protein H0W48_00080 [Methylibium sp.]|nr:hypothetical protein [Methylibium sp.]